MAKRKRLKPPKKEFKKDFKKALKRNPLKKRVQKKVLKKNPLKREFHKKPNISKRTRNSNTRYKACGI
ncbi:hypothetical protein HpNP140_09310 [Helicobacter pylori]